MFSEGFGGSPLKYFEGLSPSKRGVINEAKDPKEPKEAKEIKEPKETKEGP